MRWPVAGRRACAGLAAVAAGLLLALPAIAPAAADTASGPAPVPASGAAAVAGTVKLRTGNHDGFGRMVFDLPAGVVPTVERGAAEMTVRFAPPGLHVAPPPPAAPRNAGAITLAAGAVTVALAPATKVRTSRLPGRLVLDFLDAAAGGQIGDVADWNPAAPDAAAAPPRPPPAPAARLRLAGLPMDALDLPGAETRRHLSAPAPAMPVPALAAPVLAAPVLAAPVLAPNAAPGSAGTEAVAATPLSAPGAAPLAAADAPVAAPPEAAGQPARPSPDPTMAAVAAPAALPLSARAGVAAFRRGGMAVLVADADAPADPAAWMALPGLAEARIENLPNAVAVTFPLPVAATPALRHGPGGWTLDLATAPPPDAAAPEPSIPLGADPQHLLLSASRASRVVSVADPLGGGTLLVGTLLPDAAPVAVAATRALPALLLLPTWRGVAVEPLSDSLDMRAVAAGFVIELGAQRAAMGLLPDAPPESAKPGPKAEAAKAETGKTETGKPETGKPETGRIETGKTETGKPETVKTETATSESGASGPAKDAGEGAASEHDATTAKVEAKPESKPGSKPDFKSAAGPMAASKAAPVGAGLNELLMAASSLDAAGLDRLFDLPPLPLDSLVNRRDAAARSVSQAAPRVRGAAQLRLAETMVALGLGVEAQAVLRLAVAADGRLAADPKAVALGGIAALLAGRPAESAGLDDPTVRDATAGTDEIAFWRAWRAVVLAAGAGGPPPADAVRALATRIPLALSYPPPLRARLLPGLAEAVAEAGVPRAAERLLAAAGGQPGLDYARALLAIRGGHADAALAVLDRLALSPDRNERARSAARAVELRLATGQLTPAKAADGLERLLLAWRGDDREAALRVRVAALRAQAGQFRAALAMLRETRAQAEAAKWSPARRTAIAEQMAAVFAQTLAHDDAAPLEPLEFVALIEDNADLLPSGAQGEQVARRVADRLAALDLPARAAVALRRLVDGAPPGVARATLGLRLSATQLEGDPQGSLLTLSGSTAADLPAALVADRTLIYARATARLGNVAAATGALAALDTPAAEALRADLLEQAADWPATEAALSRIAGRELPAGGPLDGAAGALVLRLAGAAAQAGDTATLERLRNEMLPRMAPGPGADMLRVLTEDPVRGVADLPRAAQEAALARSVVR